MHEFWSEGSISLWTFSLLNKDERICNVSDGKDWEVKKPKLEKSKNPDFWIGKIERNMQRDLENDQKLQFLGWTVIHFWGKEIKKDLEGCVRVIEEAIFENMISGNESNTSDE